MCFARSVSIFILCHLLVHVCPLVGSLVWDILEPIFSGMRWELESGCIVEKIGFDTVYSLK